MDFILSLLNGLPGSVGQGLMWGIMAIGVYITYRVLDIADLTVDGSLATGGAVCVLLTVNGVNVWLAALIAMLVGMLAGLVTGLFHTKCGIPAILAGILTQLALYSVNLRIMGWGTTAGTQSTLAVSVDKYDLLVSSRYVRELALRNPILLLVVIAAVVVGLLYWFFGTEIGCGIRATGANRNMARSQGINTERNAVIGLMISNGIVALAGALIAQYQKFADNTLGTGMVVIGLASLIIGEVLFGRGGPHALAKGVLAATVGAVVYRIIVAAAIAVNIDAKNMKLVSALIVAAAISYPAIRDKVLFYRKRREANRNV